MREIKFRYYNKLEKKMVNWEDVSDDFSIFALNDHEPNDEVSEWMQYTGLKDSIKTEIYEGDILKDFIKNQIYEVIWDNHGMFLFHPIGSNENPIDYYEFEDTTSTTATIVIGNIHENPELLEVAG